MPLTPSKLPRWNSSTSPAVQRTCSTVSTTSFHADTSASVNGKSSPKPVPKIPRSATAKVSPSPLNPTTQTTTKPSQTPPTSNAVTNRPVSVPHASPSRRPSTVASPPKVSRTPPWNNSPPRTPVGGATSPTINSVAVSRRASTASLASPNRNASASTSIPVLRSRRSEPDVAKAAEPMSSVRTSSGSIRLQERDMPTRARQMSMSQRGFSSVNIKPMHSLLPYSPPPAHREAARIEESLPPVVANEPSALSRKSETRVRFVAEVEVLPRQVRMLYALALFSIASPLARLLRSILDWKTIEVLLKRHVIPVLFALMTGWKRIFRIGR
ncbi:hypothetical protein BJ742DRAFT_771691 [Cladochytrium replicatum]|nr:hypothetical protein BJ742DRAFT_771691 [Cladochytrium replicatum]